jgi:hypothetical protein
MNVIQLTQTPNKQIAVTPVSVTAKFQSEFCYALEECHTHTASQAD